VSKAEIVQGHPGDNFNNLHPGDIVKIPVNPRTEQSLPKQKISSTNPPRPVENQVSEIPEYLQPAYILLPDCQQTTKDQTCIRNKEGYFKIIIGDDKHGIDSKAMLNALGIPPDIQNQYCPLAFAGRRLSTGQILCQIPLEQANRPQSQPQQENQPQPEENQLQQSPTIEFLPQNYTPVYPDQEKEPDTQTLMEQRVEKAINIMRKDEQNLALRLIGALGALGITGLAAKTLFVYLLYDFLRRKIQEQKRRFRR